VETITGVVQDVDVARPAVIVLPRGGRAARIAVDHDKVVKDGTAIPLDRLRRGDRVVVNFCRRPGGWVALSIGVQEHDA
jgi:hypothetical protein